MSIGAGEVEHIAKLARLSITDKEKDLFGSQLAKIIEYIEKLKEVDTSHAEPTSHVLELTNVMREDIQKPSLNVNEIIGNAPDRSDNYYRVPKII